MRFDLGRIPVTSVSLTGIIANFNCFDPETYYVNADRVLVISNTSCSKF